MKAHQDSENYKPIADVLAVASAELISGNGIDPSKSEVSTPIGEDK